MASLPKMTVVELKKIAKEKKIPKYSTMKKQQLLNALRSPGSLISLSQKRSVGQTVFRNPGYNIGEQGLMILTILYYFSKYKNATSPLLHQNNTVSLWDITWDARNELLLTPFDVAISLKKCLKDDARFIIIPLVLEAHVERNKNPHALHQNIIIFDKQTKKLERFDPWGYTADYFKPQKLNQKLLFLLNKYLKANSLVVAESFCPLRGPQTWEGRGSVRRGDPGGFCVIWSLWWLSLRLKYPNVERKVLMEKAKLKAEGREATFFRRFIRNYSDFIARMVYKKIPACLQVHGISRYHVPECRKQFLDVIDNYKKTGKF
tara:strand:+ start:8208 stop:9164 length:957 start_codon:yes stop_codon:yes gene_type:complete